MSKNEIGSKWEGLTSNSPFSGPNLERDLWIQWLFAGEQNKCHHPAMIDNSFAGPDTGVDDCYCPHCYFEFHHVIY